MNNFSQNIYINNLKKYTMQYYYCNFNDFCKEQKSKIISRLLNDQFNKKYGGKKLWTL